MNEISLTTQALSCMSEIVLICNNPEKIFFPDKENILASEVKLQTAINFVSKLGKWLTEDQLKDIYSFSMTSLKPNFKKQAIARDICLIDILIKTLHYYFEKNLFSLENLFIQNKNRYFYVIAVINLLRLIAYQNEPNSFYIIQWYNLLKDISKSLFLN